MSFRPRFTVTNSIVRSLGKIEAAKAVIALLPLPPDGSILLRRRAMEQSTLNSTQIEGNPLRLEEVRAAVGSDRTGTSAEQEVRNYWRALDLVDLRSESGDVLTDSFIRELHSVVIVRGPGRRGVRSDYRTAECPVVDSASKAIVCGPPEPADVPPLMRDLVGWLASTDAAGLSTPLRAGLLAHRFLSIHPFGDGNGRTARLLATAEMWRESYGMKGFLSFDEHFNRHRAAYYAAIQMGLPVNYYDGRNDPDHTQWLEYFLGVVAGAAEALVENAAQMHRALGREASPWDGLNRRQQQVLTRLLLKARSKQPEWTEVRPADIADWFEVSAGTARDWLKEWAGAGFVEAVVSGQGERIRRYVLTGS
jgi:Fic family protein